MQVQANSKCHPGGCGGRLHSSFKAYQGLWAVEGLPKTPRRNRQGTERSFFNVKMEFLQNIYINYQICRRSEGLKKCILSASNQSTSYVPDPVLDTEEKVDKIQCSIFYKCIHKFSITWCLWKPRKNIPLYLFYCEGVKKSWEIEGSC